MNRPPRHQPTRVVTIEGWYLDLSPEDRMTEHERRNPLDQPGWLSQLCMWWLRRRGFVIAMFDHRSRLIRWAPK